MLNSKLLLSNLLLVGATLSLGLTTAAEATVINLDGTGGAANFNGTWAGAQYASGGITSDTLGASNVSFPLSMNNGKGIVQSLSSLGLSFNPYSSSSTMYFGGTLAVTGLVGGNAVWSTGGGQISAGFSGPNYGGTDTWNTLTTQPNANHNVWGASTGGNWSLATQDHFDSAYTSTTQGVASGAFDFVLAVTGGSNATQTFSLWLGANADAATPGTPNVTWNRGGAWDGPYYNDPPASVGIGASLSDGTSLTASNMFVSDTWNPVVQPVPEPSSYAMALAGAAFAAGQLWRRRKRA